MRHRSGVSKQNATQVDTQKRADDCVYVVAPRAFLSGCIILIANAMNKLIELSENLAVKII